jgi:hypothetical protein
MKRQEDEREKENRERNTRLGSKEGMNPGKQQQHHQHRNNKSSSAKKNFCPSLIVMVTAQKWLKLLSFQIACFLCNSLHTSFSLSLSVSSFPSFISDVIARDELFVIF